MSLNYTQLQTEVASYLARGNLTTKIPGFITKGENYLNRRLRVLAMEQIETESLSANAQTLAFSTIATKIVKVNRIWLVRAEKPTEIVRLDQTQFLEARVDTAKEPAYWCAIGQTVYFDGPADQAYTLYVEVTRGFDIATDSTNWLSENHEEAYTWSALVQAEGYMKNDPRIGTWKSQLDEILKDIIREDKDRRGAGRAIMIPEISKYVGQTGRYNIFSDA